LTPTGNQRWIYRYNGSANNIDDALAIVSGADGNLYTAGTSIGTSSTWDYTVISINPALGIEQTDDNCKLKIENYTMYPNPAKTYFTIRLRLDEVCLRRDEVRLPQTADRSEIKIFDVNGNIVKSDALKSSNGQEIRISLDGIKNGVYFVKVGDEIVKEKLVVTK
jgi:hypothetical protein